jgi:hypothetical protein
MKAESTIPSSQEPATGESSVSNESRHVRKIWYCHGDEDIDVTPRECADRYQRFAETYCFHLRGRIWWKNVSPKRM